MDYPRECDLVDVICYDICQPIFRGKLLIFQREITFQESREYNTWKRIRWENLLLSPLLDVQNLHSLD